MAKKKSWFSLVKRLFIWDTQSKQEKKGRRRKWIFGRLKIKRLPSITAPPPSSIESTQSSAEEEQSKHVLTAAIASAASATETAHQCKEETEEFQLVKCMIRDCAAIKIQTAFRGYLAKKALRALKGIVKLQAIIRGRAVRRQAMSTLKCLQSIVDIQSQVCARRLQMVQGRSDYDENQEIPSTRDKIIKMDSNSERRRDESILLKEETDASFRSKKEVPVKRECVKECSFNHRMDPNSERRWDDSVLLKEEADDSYTSKKEATVKRELSFNHRRSAESERNKLNGRWRYWLEQWVDTQISKSKELEDLDSIFSSHGRTGEEYGGGRQLKLRTTQRQNQVEGSFYSPKFSPRKPFSHRRQGSLGDDHDHSISSSSVIPTYMAATESARAKARSSSSPKLRTGNLDLTNFGNSNSPSKKKLSLVSSINSEVQQRSPSLKGISGPVKSSRIKMKDLSVNSDGSLPNWDQHCAFKREIFK